MVDLINEFDDYGYATEVHFTRKQGHATELGQDTKKGNLVYGWDGTLNEVIEGIIIGGIAAPLGYIQQAQLMILLQV